MLKMSHILIYLAAT